jgi:MFS family permease
MTSDSTPLAPSAAPGKTVQDYIDETPVWADATPVHFSPMTSMQWLIWALAAAGKFFEGAVVFTTGVALPLMAKEFGLGATEKGVVAAASLFGILIGATALGDLADRYGRKQMFIVEMVLFVIFVLLLTFSPSYPVVVVALVGIGIALGCDYPTAHLMISESMPSRIRGRMVLGAFGFQAVGGLAGTAIGFLILYRIRRSATGAGCMPARLCSPCRLSSAVSSWCRARLGCWSADGSRRLRQQPSGCCGASRNTRKKLSCTAHRASR